jgi:serine/threonine-protein kinase SRPK1
MEQIEEAKEQKERKLQAESSYQTPMAGGESVVMQQEIYEDCDEKDDNSGECKVINTSCQNGCNNTQLCHKSMGDNEIERTEAINMQQLHEGRSCGKGVTDTMAPVGDVKIIEESIQKSKQSHIIPNPSIAFTQGPKIHQPDPAFEECEVEVKIADLGHACWVNRHFAEPYKVDIIVHLKFF